MEESIEISKFNSEKIISNMIKGYYEEVKNHEGDLKPSHITFDKDVVPEYHIIRASTHDGTMLFTQQLIEESFLPLINRTTCFTLTQPKDEDVSKIKEINYVIGEMELKSEFGMKDLACGRYAGQTDTVTIPVRCIYILK